MKLFAPSSPIGVLDSGFGGLSVLQALRTRLPHENFVYMADCGNTPWGDKSEDVVKNRIIFLVDRLLRKEAKCIVLACNTASTMMHKELVKLLPIPVIGITPPFLLASQATQNGKIGVMATANTLMTKAYRSLHRTYQRKFEITAVPCPGLMERVEIGDFTGPNTKQLIKSLCTPLHAAQVDTIALMCTHYPFLQAALTEEFPDVQFIEPSEQIAAKLEALLVRKKMRTPHKNLGKVQYVTSAVTPERNALLSKIVQEDVQFEELQ